MFCLWHLLLHLRILMKSSGIIYSKGRYAISLHLIMGICNKKAKKSAIKIKNSKIVYLGENEKCLEKSKHKTPLDFQVFI